MATDKPKSSDRHGPLRSGDPLFRIARFSTALAFGFMVGSLFAVQPIPNGLTFRVTIAAVVAFAIAGIIAWFYWRLVETMAAGNAPEQRRRRFVLFSLALAVIGVLCFLYPLKFVPEEKRKDIAIGLSLAIACIVGIGFVMVKVKRFLDADQKRTEEMDDQK